jgi:DNA-binding MarR family transcriptional regulator
MSDMGETTVGPVRLIALLGALGASGRKLFARRLASEDWVAQAGLRPPSYGVLMAIGRLGPVSQKQISDQMALDPSDLVGVIDILEAAGFLVRSRDPQDRRRYSLTLTAAGRKALARFDAVAAEVEEELLAPLDDDERQAFRGLVERVLAHQRQAERPG